MLLKAPSAGPASDPAACDSWLQVSSPLYQICNKQNSKIIISRQSLPSHLISPRVSAVTFSFLSLCTLWNSCWSRSTSCCAFSSFCTFICTGSSHCLGSKDAGVTKRESWQGNCYTDKLQTSHFVHPGFISQLLP